MDYYTNLGLLKAERSTSNYRYYPQEAIVRLQKIEEKKEQGMSLEKIKHELEKENVEEIDIQEIRLHMQYLEKKYLPCLNKLITKRKLPSIL
ncbi:MerR family transcriptional regulator [Psychrobacillus sp. NEAU-3TGS]|nr:MerR family transcriptional regulator [Psychrobacillus sp. NEAU-3TGS]MDI2588635.1 MerR family transcriptional regulator [Psychrobacillus sp. NEAU-3TGS]